MGDRGAPVVLQRIVDGRRRGLWTVLFVLAAIALVFFVIRLLTDVPAIATGDVPDQDAFEYRYVRHPVPAYLHMIPGVIYLVGAPFQLSRRFRSRNLARHRLLGRIVLPAGLVAGVLAVVVGLWFPYGGPVEASAAVLFGAAFVVALVLAYRAIRARDVDAHRRWMIRAFALGLGVGTIRIWIGLFQLSGLLAIQDTRGTVWFGVAFWLAFAMHAAAAELYLRFRPRSRLAAG